MELDLTGLVLPERIEIAELSEDGRSGQFIIEVTYDAGSQQRSLVHHIEVGQHNLVARSNPIFDECQ